MPTFFRRPTGSRSGPRVPSLTVLRLLPVALLILTVMVDLLTEMRSLRPLDDLRRVRCPVWLVNGQWDHFRGQERAYLRACPSARLVVVRGATHLVNLVRPVAFTRVLLEALDEVGALQ